MNLIYRNIRDFATGFATGGTGFVKATANVADVIPLWKEVEFYKDYQKKLTTSFGHE